MEVSSEILYIITLIIGFYMAWNIGANDVSNAMGTSVGSGALTLKKAVCFAAVLEFCGAYFAGNNVSETIQSGLVDLHIFSAHPTLLILGMCCALLGTSIWLQVASYFGWPVSTTHAVIGAVLGFGFVAGGSSSIEWGTVWSIVLSWIISPALSALVAYTIFSILQKKILFAMNPAEATRKLMPFLVFLVLGTFTMSLFFNGLQNLHLALSFSQTLWISIAVGLLGACICYLILQRRPLSWEGHAHTLSSHTHQDVISLEKAIKHLQRVYFSSTHATQEHLGRLLGDVKSLTDHVRKETAFAEKTSAYHSVERMFGLLQIFSACFIAFAHGANDVANAIGPIAAIVDVIQNGVHAGSYPVPSWLLAFGGIGIVVGLATWGWRVIQTIGKKITELTPTRGFCAEFGAATTILIASKMGLPISTTHCLVGAVLGVGLARGMRALNLSTLKEIALSWVVTIPASAAMSIALFYILKLFIQTPGA